MTAPAYTNDLITVTAADNTTGWSQWNPVGGGGNISLGSGPDFAIHNNVAVDGKINGAHKGVIYGGSSHTLSDTDHIYVWAFLATPGISDTIEQRGLCIGVGTSSSDMVQFHVEGNDTYGSAPRVARCYPIGYLSRYLDGNALGPDYRTRLGAPTQNPTHFGVSANITGTARGSNLACDVIRIGYRGFAAHGELLGQGDASDNPCTFAGFNTQDDILTNKWGILVDTGGSYELQGNFIIGRDEFGTELTRFEDSGVSIVIPETLHANSDFSKIVITTATTVCNFTNISIKGLSSVGAFNRGRVEVDSTNPVFNIVGGLWENLNKCIFRNNTTVNRLTLTGSNTLINNGASLTNCVFDNSRAGTDAGAVEEDNVSNLVNCTFTRGSVGHGVVTKASSKSLVADAFEDQGPILSPAIVLEELASDDYDSYYTRSSAVSTTTDVFRVSFPTPAVTLDTSANAQKLRIKWVKSTYGLSSASDPVVTVDIYESGAFVENLVTDQTLTSTFTESIYSFTASNLANTTGANLEVRFTLQYVYQSVGVGKSSGISFLQWEVVSSGGETGSISWDNLLSGYRAGVLGNGVETSNGDEALYIKDGDVNKTYTVNVSDTADTPSVRSDGAVVNVLAGGGTFQFTVSPLPSPNYEWRLYTVTAEGSMAGSVEITGAENETSATPSAYAHQYTGQAVALQIISNDYEEVIKYYTLNSGTRTDTINLEIDTND